MLDSSLYLTKPLKPAGYLAYTILVTAAAIALGYGVFHGLHSNHHLYCLSIYICILIGIFTSGILLMYTLRRLQDQGKAAMWALLLVFPLANVPLFLFGDAKAVFTSAWIVVPILGVLSLIRFLLPGKQ